MDNIIMTVGTSLVENYIANNPKKENITKEDILRYYEEEKIEDFRDRRYGAEVIALENLLEKGIFSGDRIFLVIHNTVNGKLAGDVLEDFILETFDLGFTDTINRDGLIDFLKIPLSEKIELAAILLKDVYESKNKIRRELKIPEKKLNKMIEEGIVKIIQN